MTLLAQTAASFAAGVVTGVGPCAAPRYGILFVAASQPRSSIGVALLAAGTSCGYILYGFAGSIVALLRFQSQIVYAAIALAMLAGGTAVLLRDPACVHPPALPATAGSSFLLGLSLALVVSPCCAPVAVAIAMQAAAGIDPVQVALLLAAFGLGQSLPPAVLAGVVRPAQRLTTESVAVATRVVSGALLIGAGTYYAVLA